MGSSKADAVKADLTKKITSRYDDDEGQLVSLKRTAAEKKENETQVAPSGGNDYPWGTRLTLEGESVSRLFDGLPKVGAVLTLEAKVKVIAVREQEKQKSVELQVTHVCVES